MPIIMPIKYKSAEGDPTPPVEAPPVVASPLISSDTKKYLLWGAIAVAAYFLYKKFGK